MGLYLELVSQRASGKLMSTASWIRKFVREHPEYKKDSVVLQRINYDVSRAGTTCLAGPQTSCSTDAS